MVRWVVGSTLHGMDTLSYFSFQPVLHDWSNKGPGMCYSVCGMIHIKEPLLLIGKSSPCGSSVFPLSLSEWSFTIYFTDRITHTTAFVTPVVEHWLEREIAQWVHPMKDRSDNPSHHERTLYLWETNKISD